MSLVIAAPEALAAAGRGWRVRGIGRRQRRARRYRGSAGIQRRCRRGGRSRNVHGGVGGTGGDALLLGNGGIGGAGGAAPAAGFAGPGGTGGQGGVFFGNGGTGGPGGIVLGADGINPQSDWRSTELVVSQADERRRASYLGIKGISGGWRPTPRRSTSTDLHVPAAEDVPSVARAGSNPSRQCTRATEATRM
ncbi:hypothetical protein PJK45_17465 [Mycobacterium kansasii]|uniref:PE-PGRS family protein n=2 Tax=Mycobacterium kansasii TaxID=1768 RepID=U5X1K8_MYCKA|nr:hypothetical protein [Mycobacterium kansasii]AGZ54215.1 hypothetical protein MKAN_12660 [Mycobacterium kansasii ATCC 12478]ARG57195.1 hypothetical protein B1T43_16425 [Mycobacterium kansasii]ARG62723.1 hypothetical protein B1T45_16950 [Mycobacterium kansasii]ARG69458.1 hypothetical protein B1T47_10860 [Mycobacterium kansasii]ARG80549.1 hypothetical protein B1T52_12220 [Mycobacterium kansasii]